MKKLTVLFAMFVFAGGIALGGAIIAPVVVPASGITVTIVPGQRTAAISTTLKEAKVIAHEIAFRAYVWAMHSRETMKAGEYRFSGTLTIPAGAKVLIAGSPRSEKTVRIIEGWTEKQIAGYLEKESVGTDEEIDTALRKDWSGRFSFLPKTSLLEGYLFPDTYRVFADASPDDVIEKMLAQFDRKFSSAMRADARVRGVSLGDVVILASIIEREVRADTDRAKVADIFYRRLAAQMPLQADSTVNYATGKNSPQASASDLLIDSPYNTYKYRGLPAGPIGNPGLSALNAALNPQKNSHWYFLTPKDGSVIYAKTYDEHIRNKRRFLQ